MHYGDLLFETIRVKDGKPMHLNLHIERLVSGMLFLKFPMDGFDEKQLVEAIEHEISTQQLNNARLRMTCLRSGSGYYLPQHPSPVFYLTSESITFSQQPCNQLGVYTELKRPCDTLHTFKTGNAMVQVMASIYAQENGFDDCLVLNEKGYVACALHANMWLVKKGILYTTDDLQGAVSGCMQKQIIHVCEKRAIPVMRGAISLHQLEEAEEIFLSNSIRKIVSVTHFNGRKYASDLATELFGYID